MSDLIVHNLSRISYQAALDIQQALVARVQADGGPTAHLMLLEHDPPVITLGRRGRAEHVLADRARLEALGVEIHRTRRGGEVTYHGRGQLVAYPIVRLGTRRRTVRAHVRGLEAAVISLLGQFGVEGARRDGMVGVWSGGAKVAAIGVAVSRWVAYHGLAVNVADDTRAFDLIVPCGQAGGAAVTSLSRLVGREIPIGHVADALVTCLCEALGFDVAIHAEPPDLAAAGGEPQCCCDSRYTGS